jgi:hypothetical protein
VNDGVAIEKRDVVPPHASDGMPEISTPLTDQAETAPLPEQADALPVQQPDVRPVAAAMAGDGAAGKAIAARRGGRWFSLFCAVIAVAAATVALAAPWLRPRLDTDARRWLGAGNIVSRLVTPEPAAAPAPAAAVAEAALRAQLASYDQRIRAMSDSLAAMRDELTHAVASLRASAVGNAALPAAIDGLNQRADRLQSAGAVLEARARAGSVLALAVGLRRDVDAGVSIERDCAALEATGPYPGPVDHALQELTQLSAGIPTMRDLAEAFEPVQARLAVRTASSSFSRGWARLKSWFGPSPQAADDVLLEHVRALAADGRFSETANVLEASEWAAVSADWVAMVRARATAVVATQVILTYALDATEAAYATDDGATGQKPQQ